MELYLRPNYMEKWSDFFNQNMKNSLEGRKAVLLTLSLKISVSEKNSFTHIFWHMDLKYYTMERELSFSNVCLIILGRVPLISLSASPDTRNLGFYFLVLWGFLFVLNLYYVALGRVEG